MPPINPAFDPKTDPMYDGHLGGEPGQAYKDKKAADEAAMKAKLESDAKLKADAKARAAEANKQIADTAQATDTQDKANLAANKPAAVGAGVKIPAATPQPINTKKTG